MRVTNEIVTAKMGVTNRIVTHGVVCMGDVSKQLACSCVKYITVYVCVKYKCLYMYIQHCQC